MKYEVEISCAACTNLNINREYMGKFYCPYKNEDHYATDEKCGSFCFAYSRGDSTIEKIYDISKNKLKDYSAGGCYITTIVCEILGEKDDCYYLETLRSFRENNKYNPSLQYLFVLYDVYGPHIAEALRNDNKNKYVAESIKEVYLDKLCSLIKEKQDNEAVNLYKSMTFALANRYGIVINMMDLPTVQPGNEELIGHGRKLKPINI